jgi:hypothetical protein
MYKTVFGQDYYFSNVPFNAMLPILKFRTANNNLPVNIKPSLELKGFVQMYTFGSWR